MELCEVPRRTILSWDNVKDPADKRKILIRYDKLKDKYQHAIIKKFGDPYLYCHNQLIKQYLRVDVKAIDFFANTYRVADGSVLRPERQREYVTCANWLNLLIELDNNWSQCKKFLGMAAKPELYDAVIKIFEAEVIDLPKTYQTIKRKVADYKEEGYYCLPSKKFGNSNSKKVKDEENHALLIEMLSHGAQYDDTFISIKYNKIAEQLGFKTITPVTVGNYRHKNAVIINGYRKGKNVWYDEAGKVIHTARPSAPLILINSDDNELDLYFKQRKLVRKKKTSAAGLVTYKDSEQDYYYYRPTLYVVIDAFNDYILGYAIGDTNTQDLVKAAYLNAANHVKELTGGRYFWRQIKTDRWGIDPKKQNDFSQWFSAQAEFTPTELHNSRGKVIEQSFRGHWSSKLKELFPKNYSGNNITAKGKLNREWVESNKANFPTIDQVSDDVAQFINEMRQIEVKGTGKTRQQVWLTAFATMQESEKRLISDEQHFNLLGYTHFNAYNNRLESNKITKSGLMPTINGEQFIFEVPKNRFLDTIGAEVYIKYDPYDLSQVLAITKDEKIQMVCNQYERMPMALADYKTGDKERLNNLIGEKMSHVKQIAAGKEHRQNVLKRMQIDAESVLGAGVILKEIKHAATQIAQGNYSDPDDFDEAEEVEEIITKRRNIRDKM
ncbi:MAG: hypothetical protein C0154_08820 [Mucilaginibacter sp.]|nr:MAG: hypothetical protein C0154_08820 [Mucilaginibacter sp.]